MFVFSQQSCKVGTKLKKPLIKEASVISNACVVLKQKFRSTILPLTTAHILAPFTAQLAALLLPEAQLQCRNSLNAETGSTDFQVLFEVTV